MTYLCEQQLTGEVKIAAIVHSCVLILALSLITCDLGKLIQPPCVSFSLLMRLTAMLMLELFPILHPYLTKIQSGICIGGKIPENSISHFELVPNPLL